MMNLWIIDEGIKFTLDRILHADTTPQPEPRECWKDREWNKKKLTNPRNVK